MGDIMTAYVTDVNYVKKGYYFFMLLVIRAELLIQGDSSLSKRNTAGAFTNTVTELIQKALRRYRLQEFI